MNDEGTTQRQPSGHEPADTIAAYALGVLDPEERGEIEAHLATCSTCREELAQQEAVVGELGHLASPVPPSPEVRQRLLSDVRASTPAPAGPSLMQRRVPASWLGLAAVISLIAIATLGALLARTTDERNEALEAERRIVRYLADGGTLAPLVPAPGAAADVEVGHGAFAVAPDQPRAMLVLYNLAPSGDARQYMAWAERDGERVRLGEVSVNDNGVGWLIVSGPEPMSTYETIGITRFSQDAPDGEPFLVATIK